MIPVLALLLFGQSVPEADIVPDAAPLRVTIQPYAALLSYDNSEKDSGWIWGTYGNAISGRHQLELGYEYTELRYADSGSLRQNDLTAVYSNFIGSNYLARLGAHYLMSTDEWSDGGTTLFGGLKYYEGYEFDTALDVYYTAYPDYPNAGGHPRGLDVWQFSPSIGRSFGDYTSEWGSFYARLGYVHIRPGESDLALLDNAYHSIHAELSNYNGAWTTAVRIWGGKQVFGVRNDGFTVLNLAEEYRGGARLSAVYALGAAVSLKVLLSYERFREPFNSSDSGLLVLGGFLVYSF